MNGEWEYEDEREHYGYQRWEHRKSGENTFGDSSVVIDRNERANIGCTGRVWEWWTCNTSWNTFPPSCRTLEQRKAYAMIMARMS